MSVNEAKQFAQHHNSGGNDIKIIGFTYNNKGHKGGSAFFKGKGVNEVKRNVFDRERPSPGRNQGTKHTWHYHYEIKN